MAHFAEIDENSYVKRVVAVNNKELLDENDVEMPQKGVDFLVNLFGGSWVQTSYNARIRKRYACIGDFYDEAQDAFVPKQPFGSWIFNKLKWTWEAPVPKPVGGYYVWNEETESWTEQQ